MSNILRLDIKLHCIIISHIGLGLSDHDRDVETFMSVDFYNNKFHFLTSAVVSLKFRVFTDFFLLQLPKNRLHATQASSFRNYVELVSFGEIGVYK